MISQMPPAVVLALFDLVDFADFLAFLEAWDPDFEEVWAWALIID